ncbi:MAG: acireductone synthase [Persephonella sp.]|nr:MAG: acireductone synthase [Persephonella sp.]
MIKVILVDIEGTISPINFVKNVMFPYSKENLGKFLKENYDKPEIKKILEDVEKIEGRKLQLDEIIQLLKKWIDEDKKLTPLKEIQGYIWEEGFKSGKLKAPLFEDAYKKLKEWKKKGYKIFIYSSGSVKAQKLFFSHSEFGNILNLFNGHFDTKIGNKKDKNSYLRIAKELGVNPNEIIFLSDSLEEIIAAKESGMNVIKVSREGETEWVDNLSGIKQVKSFNELDI